MSYKANFFIAQQSNWVLPGSGYADLLLATGSSNQSVHIGVSNLANNLTVKGATGFVGVGTSTPGYKLDVAGDINLTGTFRQNGAPYIGSQFSNSGAAVFLIGSNLAVGKSNPSVALDVNGAISATSYCNLLVDSYTSASTTNAPTAAALSNVWGFVAGYSNLDTTRSTFASNAAVAASNIAFAYSNEDYPRSVFASNMAVFASNAVATAGAVQYSGSNLYTMSNLGVGTSTPAYNLDVAGDINLTGTFRQNGAPYTGSQFSNNGAAVFLLGSNFGVGTSDPQAQMHVTNNLRVDGNLAFNGIELTAGGTAVNTTGLIAATSNIQGYSNLANGLQLSVPGSNDIFKFVAGAASAGVEVARLTGDGKLGVGKSNPAYPLDVNGTASASSIIIGTLSPANQGLVSIRGANSNGNWRDWSFSVGGSNFGTYDTERLRILNNGTENFTFDSTGKFGIGTSNPAFKLDIENSASTFANSLRCFAPNLSNNAYVGMLLGNNGCNNNSWLLAHYRTADMSSSNYFGLAPGGGGYALAVQAGGNVGIGTTTPASRLHVNTTTATGDIAVFSQSGTTFAAIADEASSGTEGVLKLYRDSVQKVQLRAEGVTYFNGGNFGIGTSNPATLLHVYGSTGGYGIMTENVTASDASSKTLLSGRTNASISPLPFGGSIFLYCTTGANNNTPYRYTLVASTYFTGQHAGVPLDSNIKTNITDYIGLIVSSADQGYVSYNTATYERITGKDAITINECLPHLVLSSNNNDPAVFGVLSDRKDNASTNTDGTTETDANPQFETGLFERVRVNSIGEGAIWVTNINGNINNGDYITSSIIPGMGRKQDDDILHNYTVAKATMSCAFDVNSSNYNCVEFTVGSNVYKKAFIGCTYHCG